MVGKISEALSHLFLLLICLICSLTDNTVTGNLLIMPNLFSVNDQGGKSIFKVTWRISEGSICSK